MNNKVLNCIVRAVLVIVASVLIGVTLLCIIPTMPVFAVANSFDDSNVLDDLAESTVGDLPFQLNDYPFDSTGAFRTPKIINFVEYCYSFRKSAREHFGLYLYFYNPQALNIEENSVQNKVQLAVSYNADGTPSGYDKFDLKYCNKVVKPGYENLFYKYKIVDHKGVDGKTILDRVNSNERRYDLSGIELLEKGKPTAVEYKIGGTYKFCGYTKGCGGDVSAASSLTSVVNELETIQLDVHPTFWRGTEFNSIGEGHRNELNSVYFSVDNAVLSEYGKLQKILAEWYEYKTAVAVVTEDKVFYDDFLGNYVGDVIPETGSSTNLWKLYSGRLSNKDTVSLPFLGYRWSYNIPDYTPLPGDTVSTNVHSDSRSYQVPFIFCSGDRPLKGYSVSNKVVADYIYNYNASFHNGRVPSKTKEVSADLFSNEIDDGRTRGYNKKNIDSDDLFDLKLSGNKWNLFWQSLFPTEKYGAEFKNISPIHRVVENDLLGNVADWLFISPDSVDSFKNYVHDNEKKEKTTFLFRFGQNDYFSEEIGFMKRGDVHTVEDKAYRAISTVFLDFDIIQLTFNKNGVYHTIPVVSSPIDIINSFDPPIEKIDWLKILLAIILLLVILVILAPVLPYIVKFIVAVVSLPFRAIAGLYNIIRGKK